MTTHKSRGEDQILIMSFLYAKHDKHDQDGGIPPHSSFPAHKDELFMFTELLL